MIAEGFLVLPFSRRDKVHTGHHPAVPARLAQSGLLHHDGSAPDVSGLRPERTDAEEARSRLPEQVRVRLAKLKVLQRNGVDAYPVGCPPSHTVAQALDADDQQDITVAGRILRIRDFGGAVRPAAGLVGKCKCCWTIRVWSGAARPTSPRPSISAT